MNDDGTAKAPERMERTDGPNREDLKKLSPEQQEAAIQAAGNLEDIKIPTRRAKMLMVNPSDFMFLFTKGLKFRKHTKIIEGIPEDAELLTVAAEPVRHAVMLVVQSQEYDEIPINEMPPVQLVSINTTAGTISQGGGSKKLKRKRK